MLKYQLKRHRARTEGMASGRTLYVMAVTWRAPVEGIERLTDGIVQTQRLISVPPLISHPGILLHNQGLDIQEL